MNLAKKSLLFLGLFSLGISPLHALTSKEIELVKAVKRGSSSSVAYQLKQGADVNAEVETETVLMIAINELAEEAKRKSSVGQGITTTLKGAGLTCMGAVMTLMGLITFNIAPQKYSYLQQAKNEFNKARGKVSQDQIDAIAQIGIGGGCFVIALSTLPQGLIKIVKGLGVTSLTPIRNAWILSSKTAVVKELLKNPAIDLTITNNKSQTALDIVHSHMIANMDNRCINKTMAEVDKLLIEAQNR